VACRHISKGVNSNFHDVPYMKLLLLQFNP